MPVEYIATLDCSGLKYSGRVLIMYNGSELTYLK